MDKIQQAALTVTNEQKADYQGVTFKTEGGLPAQVESIVAETLEGDASGSAKLQEGWEDPGDGSKQPWDIQVVAGSAGTVGRVRFKADPNLNPEITEEISIDVVVVTNQAGAATFSLPEPIISLR